MTPQYYITINTDKAQFLEVGMTVVLNEKSNETGFINFVDRIHNKVNILPTIKRYFSSEEIDNFPLRVKHKIN